GAAVNRELGVEGERAVLEDAHHVDQRRGLRRGAVEALVGDGAGGAGAGDGGDLLGRGGVGLDPAAGGAGDEDVRAAEHAVAGVDAFWGVEADDDALAAVLVDLVAHGSLRVEVAYQPPRKGARNLSASRRMMSREAVSSWPSSTSTRRTWRLFFF